MKFKKILILIFMLVTSLTLHGCNLNIIVVYTEVGFAPFEYIKHGEIVGVDIDIMNKVGEKLGKKVRFENISFDMIIDVVGEGKITNVGAAGLSITEERLQKVDFSNVYYQANLYVIFNTSKQSVIQHLMDDDNIGVYWSSLTTNKGVGIQTGTTADLFLSDEVSVGGSLENTRVTNYSKIDTAIADIGLNIDYVIIDELPAKKLVANKPHLNCLPLYYQGEVDELAYDEYAIAVTKNQPELLNAINEVLDEMMQIDEESGINQIQELINYHLNID